MDHAAEERFVNAFIRKNRRKRLLYELTTPKKRYEGVSRFCHQAREFLDPAKILMEGDDLERRPEFKKYVQRHDTTCQILSPEFYMDELFLPLSAAVDQAVCSLDAVVIIGDGFAVVYEEPVKEGRGKYLMAEAE